MVKENNKYEIIILQDTHLKWLKCYRIKAERKILKEWMSL